MRVPPLYKPTIQVLSLLIAVASLVTGAAFLWTGTHDLWAMAVLVLFAGVLFAGYVLREAFKENEQLTEELEKTRSDLAEVTSAFHEAEGNGAIANYMVAPPHSDDVHHYTLIHEAYVIHRHAGTFTWTLQGFNASDEVSSEIMLKVSGDTALASERLAPGGVDVDTRRPLNISVVIDQPSIKVCKVEFPEPLAPNAWFHIRVSCRWENAFQMTEGDDYVFIPWGSFATRGVDRLEGTLTSDVTIHESTLALLEGAVVVRKEPGLPFHKTNSGGQSVLEWAIDKPEGLYRVAFSRKAQSVARISK